MIVVQKEKQLQYEISEFNKTRKVLLGSSFSTQ